METTAESAPSDLSKQPRYGWLTFGALVGVIVLGMMTGCVQSGSAGAPTSALPTSGNSEAQTSATSTPRTVDVLGTYKVGECWASVLVGGEASTETVSCDAPSATWRVAELSPDLIACPSGTVRYPLDNAHGYACLTDQPPP